jgi:predicted PurR-regulated permease PerM
MQRKQTTLFVLTLIVFLGGTVYLLGSVLTPFLAGALLAYLADPLVTKLMRWHCSRLLSCVIVFIALFTVLTVLVLLLVPLLQTQIEMLMDALPDMIAWVQDTIIPWLHDITGLNTELINVATVKKMLAENMAGASGAADWLVHKVLLSGAKLIELLMNLILIPVVTFYLLCDWKKVLKGIRSLVPRTIEPTFTRLVKDCDSVLGAFFRGQLLVMLSLGTIYAVGLSLVGLHIGVTIGLIAGLLTIVPYLGSIIGIVAASIAAFVQFGTVSSILLVCLVFVIGHVIEHVFLTPKLVGDRIGLHPVAVIFAILAGGSLFGFLGVLLALPVAAVTMVWLRYLLQQYHQSQLYKQS